MANINELAAHWQDFPYSYDSRDELPDGDEVWVWDTLNLGLPALWLKHPDGSFENWIVHTPGYDRPTGEHWCWNCHHQMAQHGDVWVCTECGDEIDDEDINALSSPTEEASYPEDSVEPEPEWMDIF